MTFSRLLLRSLRCYWRTGIMVVCGVAVATAVLTGSLLVGDSVTWSIRHTALARLGNIDIAMSAPRSFQTALVANLQRKLTVHGPVPRIVPLYITAGAVTNPTSEIVLPRVNLLGVDDDFWQCYPTPPPHNSQGRRVVINAALAHDLGCKEGDALLLSAPRGSALAANLLFAQRKREATLHTARVVIAAVLPDTGAGGFSLATGTATPRNLFVARGWLLRQLDEEDIANTLVVAAPEAGALNALQAALPASCSLTDYGLSLVSRHDYLALQSTEMVLKANQLRAAQEAARTCGATSTPSSVYLADRITNSHSPATPLSYAMLAGVPSLNGFTLVPGSQPKVEDDGIWLNAWSAMDLQAHVGDPLRLEYLVYTPDGQYQRQTLSLLVRGILALQGSAADPGWVPEIEGITNASRIDSWQAPFPLELARVTPRDELYWNQYHALPKAFISQQRMQAIWQSATADQANGWVTSLRIHPGPTPIRDFPRLLQTVLLRRLRPADAGLVFRPLRQAALAAADGGNDFGGLFLSMSLFLVAAAAGLAGMLMRLMADRRAVHAGIMLAQGFTPSGITRALLSEGMVLTSIGVAAGLPFGILYARSIIHTLNTWWQGAVAATTLWPHVNPASLAVGAVSGLLIGACSVAWGARALGTRPVTALLAGWQAPTAPPATRRLPSAAWICAGSFGLALLLAILSITHALSPSVAFFLTGALLLVGGMSACQLALLATLRIRRTVSPPRLSALAWRNAAIHRRRSMLAVSLLAAAAFIIVTVAANTRDLRRINVHDRRAGSGGFSLLAVASTPAYYNFSSAAGRSEQGFSPEDEAAFHGAQVFPLPASPGDDISCLNLARPAIPRLLGASAALCARGSFTVQTNGKDTANPWQALIQPPGPDGSIPAFGDADSVMWTLHAGLGETIRVPGSHGQVMTLRIVGLIQGSIFGSELLISAENFHRLYPEITAPRYFLLDTLPGKERAAADALRRNLGEMGLEVRETADILNGFLAVQNTYLSMFLALGGLGILLGTVGLFVVLLRNALERRREFALMLATGFSRGDLVRLLLWENTGLLLAGMCCGTVAALISIAPQLTAIDAQIHWWTVGALLAGMLLIGLLSSMLAAYLTLRDRLLDALRGE